MWAAFCEHLRDCGRSGNLFALVLLLTFAGALFGMTGIGVLLGLLAAYLIWVGVEIHRQQDCFERLGQQPPLALTDLRVARTKLAHSRTQRLVAVTNSSTQRLKTQRLATQRLGQRYQAATSTTTAPRLGQRSQVPLRVRSR